MDSSLWVMLKFGERVIRHTCVQWNDCEVLACLESEDFVNRG